MSELYTIEIEDENMMNTSGNLAIPFKIGVRDSANIYFDTGIKLRGRIESDTKEAYQKGLDDAWECARKIVCFSEDGGICVDNLFDIFSTSIYNEIFRDFSVSEAMERIKAYEEEQKQIRVGDEVKAWYGNAIVTRVDEKAKTANFFYKTGDSGCDYLKNIERTGRHFDEIEAMMEKMRREE